MTDFAAARQFMVQGQVRINDVTDPRLTSAMLELPRERFVPAGLVDFAYLDRDLPVTEAQSGPVRYLLKPLVLAKLVQIANVEPDDRVLDVGCGTGYGAALLARLSAAVVALEEHHVMAREAARNLAGLSQVTTATGPLREGWSEAAPYDVIVIEGRVEFVPAPLLSQLTEDGRLVCVQGHATAAKGMIYRGGQSGRGWPMFDAAAPLLPGFAEPPAFVF